MEGRNAVVVALLVFAGCAHVRPADPIPPHDTFTIESKVLGEPRAVNVSLPVQYDGTTKFPVVYMPDGALEEDFPHVANTLLELTKRGDIEPVILVGIPNTARRRDLTPPTEVEEDKKVAPVVGGSEKFRRFIRDELFPEIEAKYRVTNERTIVGESLAGLFVIETLFLEPDMFSGYVAFSPSLWWNDHELVRKAEERLGQWNERGGALYFTAADETDIVRYTDALQSILSKSPPPGLYTMYAPKPDEHHDTIFRAAKEEGLRTVLRVLAAGRK